MPAALPLPVRAPTDGLNMLQSFDPRNANILINVNGGLVYID